MKRERKSYSRPKKPFEKARIDEEVQIKKEYGLKNKKEIWKADARIKAVREIAKKLISAEESEQKLLFDRLRKKGIEVNSIGDVLGLTKKDYLNRRLQTIVVKKGIATTPRGARQMIVHKKILVDGKVVDSPSFIVSVDLENKITSVPKKMKVKKEEEVKSE